MNEELTCVELVEQLTDLLESAVDAPTRQRLSDHLVGCEGCHVYLEQFREITRSLGLLPPEPAESRTRILGQALTAAYRRRTAT